MDGTKELEPFPWHLGLFDAHCHPTDTLASMQQIPDMRAKVLTVMATRAQDQKHVANAADGRGLSLDDVERVEEEGWRWQRLTSTATSQERKIVPAFGWHPWFSHQMYDESDYDGATSLTSEQKVAHYQSVLAPKSEDHDFLLSVADPRPFSHFIHQTRQYLQRYPLALVGEVGLDKAFRIPESWLPEHEVHRDDALTPGGREGRKLSPYRVSMEHQKKVLLAQLRLAGEMQRAVSCHGVQAHGTVYETLAETWKGHEKKVLSKRERKKRQATIKSSAEPPDSECANEEEAGPKPYPPRLCLHSFSGPAETVKMYIAPTVPCEIFFSFSTSINSWSDDGIGKVELAVRAVPDDRLLVESDLHTAGDRMDEYLEDGVRHICKTKGWTLEEGVLQLGRNWRRFVCGARAEMHS